jgi:hypothetical protein
MIGLHIITNDEKNQTNLSNFSSNPSWGGFAALTLVNQCGNKSEYIDPTDYVGKSDGSE